MKFVLTFVVCLALLQSPSVLQQIGKSSWSQMGMLSSGMIVFVDSGSCPTNWSEVSSTGNYVILTTSGAGDAGTTGGSNSYTPAGSVAAPVFTGSGATSSAVSGGTPAGTVAWPVSVPTFTGSALGTHSHGAGTLADATSGSTIKLFTASASGVSAATLSGSTAAVSAGTPAGTVAWPGSVPTFTGGALGTHTHTVTATGTNNAPAFTGNQATIQPTFLKLIACKKQ